VESLDGGLQDVASMECSFTRYGEVGDVERESDAAWFATSGAG
jgi:hypothetical protein